MVVTSHCPAVGGDPRVNAGQDTVCASDLNNDIHTRPGFGRVCVMCNANKAFAPGRSKGKQLRAIFVGRQCCSGVRQL